MQPSAFEPETVREFVTVAHSDFERVKVMLTEHPGLVNAAWNWGSGDWETALGSAAHMGRRDIAEHLLASGARIDLFAAAMLGKIEIVRAILTDNPSAAEQPGPHGIGLQTHAKKGGPAAVEVLKYLQSLKKASRPASTASAPARKASPRNKPRSTKVPAPVPAV